MYANKKIRWFIKYFMQCRVFYAVKCCFNLLRMRSQIGLAPSAPLAQGLGLGFKRLHRVVAHVARERITAWDAAGTEGAKQQRERDLSRSCLGGPIYPL